MSADVPNVATRLTLYKRVAEAKNADELRELQMEFIDRFGLLPDPAQNLFAQAHLRALCTPLGIIKLRAHAKGATLEFNAQPKINPLKLITLIQKQPKVYKLEGQKKLHISTEMPVGEARTEALTKLLELLGAE